MKNIKNLILSALPLALLMSCGGPKPGNVAERNMLPPVFPDIDSITIPADIAPINFNVDGATYVYATARGSVSGQIECDGEWADFDIDQWRQLTRDNAGGCISVDVTALDSAGQWSKYQPIHIFVSDDPMPEFGVTYRRIRPGYETFSDIGIYQRDLHSFDESAILTYRSIQTDCMNCHVANRCDANCFQIHVRGNHFGTIFQKDGKRELINTKHDSTIANCMYAYWHPTGKYVAYSLNLVHQSFWENPTKNIEVYDLASDALVLDVENHELILSPLLKTKDFESYPAFSADGNYIYFCTSKPYVEQNLLDSMRYDLCGVAFDPVAGRIGDHVDTIIAASKMGKSITHPRPSYDGKYLLYSIADYSVFPIHHREAELAIMDLQTGEQRILDEVNSPSAESFHNWNTTSRWIVFSSRRYNNNNNLLYFAHWDGNGHAGKPFMLPQRNPRDYYHKMMHSYNVPDFTLQKVDLDIRAVASEINDNKLIQVGLKK